jgi:beta-lactamase regulating signal transducer with metallopeptidase domain
MNASWVVGIVEISPLGDILLKITALLAIAWILHLLVHRSNPRWRVLLWKGAVLGALALPILWLLAPRLPVAVTPPPAVISLSPPSMSDEYTPYDILALRESGNAVSEMDASGSVGFHAAPNQEQAAALNGWTGVNYLIMLTLCWGALSLLLLAYVVQDHIRLCRVIARAMPIAGPLNRLLQEIATDIDCRQKVRLACSNEVGTPLLAGIKRPVVVLPVHMTESIFREDLTAILVHELTHLKSRDLFWIRIIQALSIVLWFHPLIWSVRAKYVRACEEICDAMAARYIGSTDEYSGTLARVALGLVGHAHANGALPMARKPEVRERLDALKRKLYSSPLAKRWIVSSGLIGAFLLTGLVGFKLVYAEVRDTDANLALSDEMPMESSYIDNILYESTDNASAVSKDKFVSTPRKMDNDGMYSSASSSSDKYVKANDSSEESERAARFARRARLRKRIAEREAAMRGNESSSEENAHEAAEWSDYDDADVAPVNNEQDQPGSYSLDMSVIAKPTPVPEPVSIPTSIPAPVIEPTPTPAFPAVYNPNNGHWYAVIPEEACWDEAKAAADNMTYSGIPGHLATLTSDAEIGWVRNNLDFKQKSGMWLGGYQSVHDREPDGGWEWITGETWSYTDWIPGEPNNGYSSNNEHYLMIFATIGTRWNDEENENQWPSVVEFDESYVPVPIPTPTPKHAVSLDPIFNPYNGHWYAVFTTEMRWDNAKTAADNMTYEGIPGHLATLTSAEEKNWVQGNLDLNGETRLWLGGYQASREFEPNGGWTWITNEPWSYTDWMPGEPNNIGNEEHHLIYIATNSETWSDEEIYALRSSIIEFEEF